MSVLSDISAYQNNQPYSNTALQYLVEAERPIINFERISSLSAEHYQNPVLDYVLQTLELLQAEDHISYWQRDLLAEVLLWSDAAKAGSTPRRKQWAAEGINLVVHNVGSAQLYKKDLGSNGFPDERSQIIYTMIYTHGLIGQYLRGEVELHESLPLLHIIDDKLLTRDELAKTLYIYNKCMIRAVSEDLWVRLDKSVKMTLDQLLNRDLDAETPFQRLVKLRSGNTGELPKLLENPEIKRCFHDGMPGKTFWYVEAALSGFSDELFIKIMMIALMKAGLSSNHISFENLMVGLYYQSKGKKSINVYRQRIIEHYIDQMTFADILNHTFPVNEHISLDCVTDMDGHVTSFNFRFSNVSESLLRFCMEAENSGPLFEKAIVMLYDLFQFRRDAYDRLQNEESYLDDMNGSLEHKRMILDYVVGDTVVDIGPGGGALLDELSLAFPEKNIIGMDIAENVIAALNKRKFEEGRSWNIRRGDALNLEDTFKAGEVSTFIFSSVLHELYSYIPFEGSKFNAHVIKRILKEAYSVLARGGRIIIRDGVKTEPEDEERIIRFSNPDDVKIFYQYVRDFKGRKIKFETLTPAPDIIEVRLPVNDAMEFLYTYTWGPEAYAHEVQEQFGYFTPREFRETIGEACGDSANIIVLKHYLQQGYEEALAPKMTLLDTNHQQVQLPDSTCFIVIEKASR